MDTVLEETIGSNNSIQMMNQSDLPIIVIPDQNHLQLSPPGSRRMTGDNTSLQELALTSRRPSAITALRRPSSNALIAQRRLMLELLQGTIGSKQSLNNVSIQVKENSPAIEAKLKNRRLGDDALTTALSALYAKLIVVLGIALPVTEILSPKAPPAFYQGFYLYLYLGSVFFVGYMYAAHLKTRAVFTLLKNYEKHQKNSLGIKKRVARYGSFYLRVGAVAFGIGSMVYSGLEFGQYFELKGDERCQNVLIALTPAARMLLLIVQMQFIFLNTKEFEMGRHKVMARFGLMHMVATNLCEWLYVLVEETKHEIVHFAQHGSIEASQSLMNNLSEFINQTATVHHMTKRASAMNIVVECRRTNIMGTLVQNVSPFLFPCTIEYSLICAVILFEMWKKIKSVADIQRSRRNSRREEIKDVHHLSVDCARAHRGMFGGILIIVLTIICLIMYFVLSEQPAYATLAILEVTISEIILYLLTIIALIFASIKMRDLKYSKPKETSGIGLDCTLLLVAQSGIYIYCIFSITGCFFWIKDATEDNKQGALEGLFAEIFSLAQTSLQTIFILNAWWRRCKGAQQNRQKPGREVVTFLLVTNMAMWFINTLIKGRAGFRPTHLDFFGVWAWTIITHVSMPLAIFYRFHSTICLFEIWKSAYKVKGPY